MLKKVVSRPPLKHIQASVTVSFIMCIYNNYSTIHKLIHLITVYEGCSEIIETPVVNKLFNKLQIVFVVVM